MNARELRPRNKAALFVLLAVATAIVVAVSIGMWWSRTGDARLADSGVDTKGTPTGEVCSFEVRKYRGSYTQYAAMYAYIVDGRRYEVRGAAHFEEPTDVPTDTTGVRVKYLPAQPTQAIAHDERIERSSARSGTAPKVTTDCAG
ncbi:hypothetical protein [Curtobacterium sp. ER1/6]|uniref:DUF3592 domain-containing protein n=1 Tax=Curtobacterium sp. ER1/6 TaxID=1891920 RepID=UPI00084F8E97|nr:hypothetical protein [Curtobacterium sp. ER1/6]